MVLAEACRSTYVYAAQHDVSKPQKKNKTIFYSSQHVVLEPKDRLTFERLQFLKLNLCCSAPLSHNSCVRKYVYCFKKIK